jgi:LAS superfamily LD-carboxypeptidase LdcB
MSGVVILPNSSTITKTPLGGYPSRDQFSPIRVGEVVDISLNGRDSGAVKFRYVGTTNVPIEEVQNIALPLLANLRIYPVRGELIVLFSLGNVYYLPINLLNNPITNQTLPILNNTLSDQKTDTIKTTLNNKTFAPAGQKFITTMYEGDLVFEGRFGNSIKFGSTVKEKNASLNNYSNSNSSNNGDPIFIIRNGIRSTTEDILKDGASIYMCSTQRLNMDDGESGFDGITAEWSSLNIKEIDIEEPEIDLRNSSNVDTEPTVKPNEQPLPLAEPKAPKSKRILFPVEEDEPINTEAEKKQEEEQITEYYDMYLAGKNIGKTKLVVEDGVPIAEKIVEPYRKLKEAAAAAGFKLTLNSGFRSMDDLKLGGKILAGQISLRKKNARSSAIADFGDPDYIYNAPSNAKYFNPVTAKPGYSNHQSGFAIDINTGKRTKVYKWLVRNALKYGWVRAVESERWHWEYRPTATSIYAKVPKSSETWDGFNDGMV